MPWNPWYQDLHLATARGRCIEDLLAIRCTRPFDKWAYYAVASDGLRRHVIRYADVAAIINGTEDVVRMRVRDYRHRQAPDFSLSRT